MSGWCRMCNAAATADRWLRHLENAAMVVSALSIVTITVIVCAEVFLRSTAGISTLISAEYAGYLLAANVYLGLAWTFRNGGFIRVELVHGLFRGRMAALLNLLIAVIATTTLLVYTWYIIDFVLQTYRSGATSIFITRTVLWVPQLVMPIGSVLLTCSMISALVRSAAALFSPDLSASEDSDQSEDWL
ncbi:MAG: TRAP transporter small permease [Roseovarius sp.]|uniref:TRAP transporter small permease subunit n=1 Tax=Roseovarius sp. TaxID=1486281 RepID=UPI0032EADF6E